MTADTQLVQVRLQNFFAHLRAAETLTPELFARGFKEHLLSTIAEQVPAPARPAWYATMKLIIGEQRYLSDDELSMADVEGLAQLPLPQVRAIVASLELVRQNNDRVLREEFESQFRP